MPRGLARPGVGCDSGRLVEVPRMTDGVWLLLELPELRKDGLGREPLLPLLLPLVLRGTAVPRDVELG